MGRRGKADGFWLTAVVVIGWQVWENVICLSGRYHLAGSYFLNGNGFRTGF